MPTYHSEDHPNREVEDSVPATPVEEPQAKVVEAPQKAPAKKSTAKVTTKKG